MDMATIYTFVSMAAGLYLYSENNPNTKERLHTKHAASLITNNYKGRFFMRKSSFQKEARLSWTRPF